MTSSRAWFDVVVENDASDGLSTVDNARHEPGCPQQVEDLLNLFTQGCGVALYAGSSSRLRTSCAPAKNFRQCLTSTILSTILKANRSKEVQVAQHCKQTRIK